MSSNDGAREVAERLAELRVPCDEMLALLADNDRLDTEDRFGVRRLTARHQRLHRCGGTVPNTRFAALRGEHDIESGISGGPPARCRRCGNTADESRYPWSYASAFGKPCLRYDMGAWVRVAAACGFACLSEVLSAVQDAFWWPAAEGFALRERLDPETAAARAVEAWHQQQQQEAK